MGRCRKADKTLAGRVVGPWLTLATVRRVQGRYADSDQACASLLAIRDGPSAIFARACQAENDSLRGEYQQARDSVTGLLRSSRLARPARNWLLPTLAESEAASADRGRLQGL